MGLLFGVILVFMGDIEIFDEIPKMALLCGF